MYMAIKDQSYTKYEIPMTKQMEGHKSIRQIRDLGVVHLLTGSYTAALKIDLKVEDVTFPFYEVSNSNETRKLL